MPFKSSKLRRWSSFSGSNWIGTKLRIVWYVRSLMFAPDPMFARNLSRISSLRSQSDASDESNSSRRPPLRMRIVVFSTGRLGFGSWAVAQTVAMELVAFLASVHSSRFSSDKVFVLSKSMSTCLFLISSRLRIWICVYDGLVGCWCVEGGERLVALLLLGCRFLHSW